MATPFTTPYSPISEHLNEGADDYTSPRGCFQRFCFRSSHNYLLQERHDQTWLAATLNKLKQFSEVVAGPKWKNFIRKFGKLCHPNRSSYDNHTMPHFQYSPQSYALNFAEDGEEDGVLLHSFSTRFAPHDHQRKPAL